MAEEGLVQASETPPPADVSIPREILSLSKGFIDAFRQWPVYQQAIVASYWQSLSPEKDQGKYVRFEADGKRWAVRLKLDHYEKSAHVSIKRRDSEGVKETDMAGTSSEDLNQDYWQEQLQLTYNQQQPEMNRIMYVQKGQSEPLKDKGAIPNVRGVLNELKGKLPIEAASQPDIQTVASPAFPQK